MFRSSRRRSHTSVEIVQAFLIPIQRGARQAHNLLNHRVRDLLVSKQTPTKDGFFIPLSVGRQRFLMCRAAFDVNQNFIYEGALKRSRLII